MQEAENGTFISQTTKKNLNNRLPRSVGIMVLLEIPSLIVVKIL